MFRRIKNAYGDASIEGSNTLIYTISGTRAAYHNYYGNTYHKGGGIRNSYGGYAVYNEHGNWVKQGGWIDGPTYGV